VVSLDLADKVDELINRNYQVTIEELDEITRNPSFERCREKIIGTILQGLSYPNLNALILAERIPDKIYEEILLSYEHMTDRQAVYWIFALGEIKSAKGFERMKQYTETSLFHQAFLSMAKINLSETMHLLETFINGHCTYYTEANETFRHDSGFNTLARVLEDHKEAAEFVARYDLPKSELKRKLVEDALYSVKEVWHQ
jgi:hypothetical protein